jgi:hypothetical protein
VHDETPEPERLPNLFVIGAPKCGTTSLHHYLDQHPEVTMTTVKEPFVFVKPDWREQLARYAELIPGDARLRGESSTVYSQHPHFPGVPARIAEVTPDPRFIYMVRDPIERAIAHYRQHVVDGKESRQLSEALADYEEEASTFLCASRYATQLRLYLEHFEPDRILVLDQRDLLEQRTPTLERVFEFLGVPADVSSPQFERQLNRAEDHRLETTLGRRVRGSTPFRAVRRLPLPGALRRPLRRLVSRPIATGKLDPDLRRRIAGSLREEVAWLREFSGLELAGWSV